MSGAKLEDMTALLRKVESGFQTITVLGGSNNISRNEPIKSIFLKYDQLVATLRENHPHSMIHLAELPSRLDSDQSYYAVQDFNAELEQFCKFHRIFLIKTSTSDRADLLHRDGLHLSEYGTAILAKKLKSTLRYYYPSDKVSIRKTDIVRADLDNPCRSTPTHSVLTKDQRKAAITAFTNILSLLDQ